MAKSRQDSKPQSSQACSGADVFFSGCFQHFADLVFRRHGQALVIGLERARIIKFCKLFKVLTPFFSSTAFTRRAV
jgi:hypothetical protein